MTPRGTIDNALKQAFRAVVGFDPVHDGAPAGTWFGPKCYKDGGYRVNPPAPLPAHHCRATDRPWLSEPML